MSMFLTALNFKGVEKKSNGLTKSLQKNTSMNSKGELQEEKTNQSIHNYSFEPNKSNINKLSSIMSNIKKENTQTDAKGFLKVLNESIKK